MFRKVKSLEESLKNMQGIGSQVSVAYKDLCLFPDVQLPVGFKMPKFDPYDGHGNPVAYLRGFCSNMRGAGGKDELLMAYFSQSLSGAALEWYTRQDTSRWYTWDDLAQAFARHFQYNIDIVPDRLSLTKVEKRPNESFREYGFRWREQAARVYPPMEEDEMVEYFLQALEPTYFGHLISAIGHDTEKCWHLKRAIQELIDKNQIVVQSPEAPNINQNPLPTHAETHMIEIVHKDGEPKNFSKSVMMIRASESNPIKALDSAKAMSLAIKGVSEKPRSLNVNPSVLVVKGPPVDVEANHERQKVIVTYKGKEVEEEVNGTGGLTHSGRCFTPEELRKTKPSKDGHIPVKNPVTEEEAEEFLKKMKMQDYSIVEQLRKTPAQISLLSLLIHSDEHRKALMKILNEAHVPDKITVNHLKKIANKIFEANMITFSDDELPIEGTEHNRALYLTVKCEDSAISRVLVDNGSSANICPLYTLQKLKIGTERIHINNVCVRGFDGGGRDSVGDIMLNLSIGPVEFTMEFQVLDVAVSYNMLLGRPWIHAAKAIPSSLHQMVKFEWDRQKIVVHGDENLSAYNDTIVPFIEVENDKGPWVYQMFETVSVQKIPEGECTPGPKIPSASVMGIVHPVVPRESFGTFGLGFTLTGKDVRRAKSLKVKAWSLPKPVPHISKSFVKSGVAKCPISVVPKPVVDFDEDLIKRFQSLFDEPNLKSQSNSEITIQEVEGDGETEYDEEAAFEKVSRELKHFEEKPKPNLNETEAINLGDLNNVRETKISVHLEPQIKEEIVKTLFAYKDVFAWSYDDMPGLSTDLVAHKLPKD
ncbi:uncharacterized protein [Nicotiana tomentosiformis]|uniref:uncharacterized protein n=1 Tax=Nicotiana tomentosiformis TaxID=4098 RepID=UPI00388C9753